jgi:hypothetical protein
MPPVEVAVILQASKVTHFSHATLFPAEHVTVPQLPVVKLNSLYAVLAAAIITSPQLTE